jgi:hypothetical protein
MLKLCALQMRELLWSPNDREEFLTLIMLFEEEQPKEFGKSQIRQFIENVNKPKPIFEVTGGVSYNELLIPSLGSEAIFNSDLCTEEFITFLMWLFVRYESQTGTNIEA